MPKKMYHPDRLTTFDVARLLGVSRVTVLNWTRQGLIPEPQYIGNKRVWTQAQVEEMRKHIKPG